MTFLRKVLGIGRWQYGFEVAYRFNRIVWASSLPIILLATYFLWTSIYAYSGQTIINGMTLNELIVYYLAVQITIMFSASMVDAHIPRLVKKGLLIRYIVKPFNFVLFWFIRSVWRSLFRTFAVLLPLFALAFVIIDFSSITFNIPGYMLSVILALFLNFFYIFSVAMICFWVKEYEGIRVIRRGVANVFNGAIIPLTFFPLVFQKAFSYLPFQYMLYVPIQILLGKYSYEQSITMMLIQLMWIIVFALISIFAWKKAQAQFMGVGV
jgi:ABC-2 type transport system permease protein